nr:MAG TPA: hypothetical protein [Caudoviricetes sp.]
MNKGKGRELNSLPFVLCVKNANTTIMTMCVIEYTNEVVETIIRCFKCV